MKVEITNKNAIIIDDTRVTNRSTKWGVHTVIDTFEIKRRSELEKKLKEKGFAHLINLMDN